MKEIYLTTTYFGPVSYFYEILNAEVAFIEVHENYEKQSWRNRCRIIGANGLLDLSVPILMGRSLNQPVRDIRIDYHQDWQKIHFKSIESAYRHSPFYEFLIDDLQDLWTIRSEFLLDHNQKITERILRLLKGQARIDFTTEFRQPGFYGESDFRYVIHPKKKGGDLKSSPFGEYHQVFSDRHGYIPGLSILDWMFNSFRT
jgi:hypothetical protein